MKKYLLPLLALPVCLFGANTLPKPWIAADKLFEFTPQYQWLHVAELKGEGETIQRAHSINHLRLQMQVALTTDWLIGAHVGALQNSGEGVRFSEGGLRGSYLLMSDLVGDFFSCALNLTCVLPNRGLLRDPIYFYHGDFDTELSCSMGKEITQGKYWNQRFWGALGIGTSTEGRQWAHWALAAEHSFASYHQVELKLDAYNSFSGDNLNVTTFNQGYGKIKQRSGDLQATWRYFLDYEGSFSLSGEYRLWGKNGPSKQYAAQLAYTCPFSF